MDNDKQKELTAFTRAATQCGSRYLAAGGPTSRIEEKLTQAGHRLGFKTEVFATPASVFVSASIHGHDEVITAFEVIKSQGINLAELQRLDLLLQRMSDGEMRPRTALPLLSEEHSAHPYPPYVRFVAVVLVCLMASLFRYNNIIGALCSGVFGGLTYWTAQSLGTRLRLPQIFGDFIGSLFILAFAGVCSILAGIPPYMTSIGYFILIVPGLNLTTAMSELAESHFVSGTIKLMRSMLVLLAMGVALLLSFEFAELYQLHAHNLVYVKNFDLGDSFFLRASCLSVVIASSAVVFAVPRSDVFWAAITGLIGWVILQQFDSDRFVVIPSFLASFSIALISVALGRAFRTPSQIYSVPAILGLVPGLLAFSTFEAYTQGSETQFQIFFKVPVIAGAIVFGFLTARIPAVIAGNDENSTVNI